MVTLGCENFQSDVLKTASGVDSSEAKQRHASLTEVCCPREARIPGTKPLGDESVEDGFFGSPAPGEVGLWDPLQMAVSWLINEGY